MAKISKEMRKKIVMAKNMSQQAIAKELRISKSGISEILKVSSHWKHFELTKIWFTSKATTQVSVKTDQDSKSSATEDCKTSDGGVQLFQFSFNRHH